ncbi:MAG: nucleotidyltransferase family protein [Alphaproteobacteria bacterium]|nr:nucleotidyltransferase family protein [Alphaproteobacteria bacterium]MCB9929238.1 nucleotidyltransferase family protein [Alphaproteobacteria bacterium]
MEWVEKPVPHLVAAALASEWQRDVLRAVRDLGLRDCWVAAGFVRNAVWDRLHGYAAPTPLADVDVLFFLDAPDAAYDEQALEARLAAWLPQHAWQVRNQARMHHVNGFRPFLSSADAMCHWVETPTAVGVALDRAGRLQINAPLGVGDLLGLRLQPGPMFRGERLGTYRQRVRAKGWADTWPKLRVLGV